MPFAEDMLPPLRTLAKKLVDLEMYAYLSEVADLLNAFGSGNWPKLSVEDQEHYLKKMESTFHVRGMGDTPAGDGPEFLFVMTRIAHEIRALQKKK